MATSNAHRVGAFFLAALFLLSTIGATAYVIWEINRDNTPLVSETDEEQAAAEALEEQRAAQAAAEEANACGTGKFEAVTARAVPKVVKLNADITALKTVDVKVGEGAEVKAGDCVAALYYGTLAKDGTVFDGNYETGTPIEFSLNGVIQGWVQGIPGMKVGGVRRLEIPADLAYGEQDQNGIPANSDLIFEVEIISARQAE